MPKRPQSKRKIQSLQSKKPHTRQIFRTIKRQSVCGGKTREWPNKFQFKRRQITKKKNKKNFGFRL